MRERASLYLISPPRFVLEDFAAVLADALAAGEVGAFQLRMKAGAGEALGDEAILEAAALLAPIVRASGAQFILNDRPDLAQRAGADGVHVGQQDATVAEARRIMGPNAVIGATCHASRHLAMEAAEAGADYVAFGAFFPTATKDPPAFADPDVLAWWQEVMALPCVAIGGLTVGNARPVIEAGADIIAVSAGVWRFPQGPAAAVRAFNAIFDEVLAAQRETS